MIWISVWGKWIYHYMTTQSDRGPLSNPSAETEPLNIHAKMSCEVEVPIYRKGLLWRKKMDLVSVSCAVDVFCLEDSVTGKLCYFWIWEWICRILFNLHLGGCWVIQALGIVTICTLCSFSWISTLWLMHCNSDNFVLVSHPLCSEIECMWLSVKTEWNLMFYRASLEKMVNQDWKENLYVFYSFSSTVSYIQNKELSVYYR